jgi:hypothetical protein
MHVLLLSGFLGSGKTTLILPLSKVVVQSGYRVAIIINEIGEIGIDNQVMRHLDLNVWELVAGCICCTLSGDLIATLQKLDLDHAPDLVIVEASGTADPKSILGALRYYRSRSLSSVRTVQFFKDLLKEFEMKKLRNVPHHQFITTTHQPPQVIEFRNLRGHDRVAASRNGKDAFIPDQESLHQAFSVHQQLDAIRPELISRS